MQTLLAASKLLAGRTSDAMTAEVRFAPADASVAEVVDLMAEHDLRRIVVVDRRQRVIGVITQRDILRHFLATDRNTATDGGAAPGDVDIRTLISRATPVTVSPNSLLSTAAAVLVTIRIGCLPVVGPHRELKGVLTISDLFRRLSGCSKQIVESEFQLYTPGSASRANQPAYLRKVNGDLVIPLSYLKSREQPMQYALLGYDAAKERILVKFVAKETEQAGDAIATKQDKENLTIPAAAFVKQFDLGGSAHTFVVTASDDGPYLVLTHK